MIGTVYLLCFEPGVPRGNQPGHARHYLGWALDHEERIAKHLRGAGSPLVAAAVALGCEVRVARTWPNVDRHFERRIKNTKALPQFCPLCATDGRAARELREAA